MPAIHETKMLDLFVSFLLLISIFCSHHVTKMATVFSCNYKGVHFISGPARMVGGMKRRRHFNQSKLEKERSVATSVCSLVSLFVINA